jgi:hypothetical protein
MNIISITRRSLQTAGLLSVLVASTAIAQDRKLVTWTGRVDKEVLITIHDTTITTGINGGQPARWIYSSVADRLPRRDGTVRVEVNFGRGDVDVTQQPNAGNDFTAIVRIRDKSVGKDNYQVAVYWNPQRGEDRYSAAASSARMASAPLPANTMHWSGSVDSDLKIEWQGFDVRTRNQAAEAAREVHSAVSNGLPSSSATLSLVVREGRGDVSIVQQPNSSNGWTAIIRVRDPQTGFGHYDFDVSWR